MMHHNIVLLSVFKQEILKFANTKCREEKGTNNVVFCQLERAQNWYNAYKRQITNNNYYNSLCLNRQDNTRVLNCTCSAQNLKLSCIFRNIFSVLWKTILYCTSPGDRSFPESIKGCSDYFPFKVLPLKIEVHYFQAALTARIRTRPES